MKFLPVAACLGCALSGVSLYAAMLPILHLDTKTLNAFDAYVKALMSTPEVTARITELENCLQQLANAVWASGLIDKSSGLRIATEEATVVLKNRLEVENVASRIRKRVASRLEPFQDELRLVKPSRTKASDSKS